MSRNRHVTDQQAPLLDALLLPIGAALITAAVATEAITGWCDRWRRPDPEHWPPLHRVRWCGRGQWLRGRIGPLCISLFVPNATNGPKWGRSWFIAHSWRWVNEQGENRHARTFRGWLRKRRPDPEASAP